MIAQLNLCGCPYSVKLVEDTYYNRTKAVHAVDSQTGERICSVSVNIPVFSEELPEGAFYVKNWSENEGMVEQLVEQGVVELVPNAPIARSGFVSNIQAYRLKK